MGAFTESTLPSAVLYHHHDFDLRLRKANSSRALFHRSCVVISAALLILLHLCIADLQPSCPGSTHRVTIAIWYPRCSKHRTNCAHFASQKPSRCGCEGRRGARPSACGCICEETWHPNSLWRSGRISKYESVTLLYQYQCANY